jgi:hypothetical protein
MALINMSNLVEKICWLPTACKTIQTKSAFQLVKESGFFENPGALSQSRVESYLRKHSYLVHDWLIWSVDKRTDRGWYFLEEAGHFVVGYSPPVGPLRDQITFSDPVKACAEFVIRELDDFRQIFS